MDSGKATEHLAACSITYLSAVRMILPLASIISFLFHGMGLVISFIVMITL